MVDCGSIQPTGAVGDTEDAEARPAVDWLDQVSLATHGRLEHLFEQLLPDPLRGTGLVVLGASAATGQPSAVEARAGAAAAAVVPVEAAASTAAAEESASTAMEGGPASNLAVEEVASSTATATAAATAATATVANEPSAELEMALAAVATASSVQVEDQTATVKSTRDVIGLEEVVLAADGVPTAGASAAARDEVLSENVCTLNNGTCC